MKNLLTLLIFCTLTAPAYAQESLTGDLPPYPAVEMETTKGTVIIGSIIYDDNGFYDDDGYYKDDYGDDDRYGGEDGYCGGKPLHRHFVQ